MNHCDECGFDYASADEGAQPGRLRGFATAYAAVLAAAADVRRRPAPEGVVAAEELAGTLATLRPDEVARTGVYPCPAPEPRSLLWVGRHSVHEGDHHLTDIRRQARPAFAR